MTLGALSEDVLHGAVDSNHAGCPDTLRSRYGFHYKLWGSVVSWFSKRNTFVTLSSTESEFVGASNCVRHGKWIINLLTELGVDLDFPVKIDEDNSACIRWGEKGAEFRKRKHIALQYYHLCDEVDAKRFILVYVPTSAQTAHVYTKSQTGVDFIRCRSELGVEKCPVTNFD